VTSSSAEKTVSTQADVTLRALALAAMAAGPITQQKKEHEELEPKRGNLSY